MTRLFVVDLIKAETEKSLKKYFLNSFQMVNSYPDFPLETMRRNCLGRSSKSVPTKLLLDSASLVTAMYGCRDQ